MFKGAIHIHSTYSDGDLTLREVREVYRRAGCSFVCMTDHAEYFTTDLMRQYLAECADLSTSDFRMIAGVEFTCLRKMHVLGIGVTDVGTGKDPREVIAHIESSGGISVIAHPMNEAFPWIESFDPLPNGIEVWNSKYDGRYAPRVATFDLLGRLQQRRPDMRAFYGQDFHWRRQYRGIFLELRAAALRRGEILQALARGDYVGRKVDLRLPSSGRLTEAERSRFQEVHQRSERIRGLVKKARHLASRWGMPVPPGVKAQLRRIF
jgi:hypothetical protein